jgi:serine/threonine-protein kinase
LTTFNKSDALRNLSTTSFLGRETLISNHDTLSGRVLDDKYKLIRLLGEGGMGAVYLASRLHIGDKAAIKVLNRKTCTNDLLIKRFRREASTAAKSCDPRIVKIYDSGETADGLIYVVMEFILAPTMRTVLQREGNFSPERAVRLMIEICDGIDAAHRQKIVHRDLKPENIMILPPTEQRKHESVVIVDFGLAKPLNLTRDQVLTEPGIMLGTMFYMSPEQLRGFEVDVRCDIYSLGAVLYELLKGKPPFTGLSVAEVIAKHILEEPPPLPASLKIKPRLESVIRRALAKDPNSRYATVKEMADALRESLQTSSSVPKRKRWLDLLTHFGSF